MVRFGLLSPLSRTNAAEQKRNVRMKRKKNSYHPFAAAAAGDKAFYVFGAAAVDTRLARRHRTAVVAIGTRLIALRGRNRSSLRKTAATSVGELTDIVAVRGE